VVGRLITVIAGPPASGKSTWLRSEARPGDLVLDWDDILAALSGLPVYERPAVLTYYANMATTAVVTALRKAPLLGRPEPEAAWIIRGAPEPERRWRFASPRRVGGLGARIVVLTCPPEICHRRIDADPRRAGIRDEQHTAVDDWWARYEPASCDEILDTWSVPHDD
jgi:hypothetical protein